MWDCVIIGAGIMGASVAYALLPYEARVLILEKEGDASEGVTMANSAVIHSGHDPKEGTLKARFNVEGNRMYEELCKDLQVPMKKCGAFVVACSEEEKETLLTLKENAERRGIPYELLTGDEARNLEKNLADDVILALSLPTTGTFDPWELTLAMLEEAVLNGADFLPEHEVQAIQRNADGTYILRAGGEEFRTKRIVNAAGLYADDITMLLRGNTPYHIHPRRGEYYVLDHADSPFVSRIIYPVPSKLGKGVLAVPTLHGNVLLGPDSEDLIDKGSINTTTPRLHMILRSLRKTVKNVPMDTVIRTFAGLRPTGDLGDFYIREDEGNPGFFHAACIESPGLTASPAIGRYIVEELMKASDVFSPRSERKRRRAPLRLAGMSLEEKQRLASENPAFSRIICRCETITEGEIVDIIRRPLGARTIKGVKKRARPGMGRCQGGFCEPRIAEILHRELQIPMAELCYNNSRGRLFFGETKSGEEEDHA